MNAREIPIELIDASGLNPRSDFDEGALQELAASIREHGVLQPIRVRPAGERFEIIMGERRYRACKLLGLAAVPAVIDLVDEDKDLLLKALVENDVRKDIDPIARAKAYRHLYELGATQGEIARKVGKSDVHISNSIRLLDLPVEVQELIRGRKLGAAVALRLIRYRDFPNLIRHLADLCIEYGTKIAEFQGGTLPHLPALEEDGLVARLDSRVTAFKWQQVCPTCPFQAFYRSKASGTFCLKPEHYRQLQEDAGLPAVDLKMKTAKAARAPGAVGKRKQPRKNRRFVCRHCSQITVPCCEHCGKGNG